MHVGQRDVGDIVEDFIGNSAWFDPRSREEDMLNEGTTIRLRMKNLFGNMTSMDTWGA